MRNHLPKKILLPMAALLLCSSVTAQSFIRAPRYIKENRSIVREVDRNIWLAHNYYFYNHVGGFSLIGFLLPQTKCYDFEDLLVHDFEVIDKKYVYYCGERHYDRQYPVGNDSAAYDSTDSHYFVSYDTLADQTVYVHRKRAVMGYFMMNVDDQSFTGFHEVEYFRDFRIRSFDKLELLSVSDGIHVLMTGSTYTGNGCLVDMSANAYTPSSWLFNIDTLLNRHMFDDVAITNKYIVATQRGIDHEGYINYYLTPNSYSTTTINTLYSVLKFSHAFKDTILVEHCNRDTFAIASYLGRENKFVVGEFDYTNLIGSVILPVESSPSPEKQLVDIKYDSSLSMLNLLQQYSNSGLLDSKIWHLDNTLLGSGGLASMNRYREHTLFSLDGQHYNSGFVIASGHPSVSHPSAGSRTFLYQHWPGSGLVCSDSVVEMCATFRLMRAVVERQPAIVSIEVFPMGKDFIYESFPVNNECEENEKW